MFDDAERLCKTIEPETGATVQDYDGANNVTWRASGLMLPSTSECNRDGDIVAAARKISYSYDKLNRLVDTVYGDGSPSIARTYTPDGLPMTVDSDGANWTYWYNKRRQHESERLIYGGNTYLIEKHFDQNGALTHLRYPDGTLIAYAPNALGEPTKVASATSNFAAGITYFPNGAIQGFKYGNGIVHTLTQNVRGLPMTSADTGVLSDTYAFDQNANVTHIDDGFMPEGRRTTRALAYDNLDRLTRVSSPDIWGDANFTYDGIDNLTSSTYTGGEGVARGMTHTFDGTTNRLTGLTGTAGFAIDYGYDSQGNITQRGDQRYKFDLGNRLSEATGRASYTYDGFGRRSSIVGADGATQMQMYSHDGKLMYAGPTGGTKTKYIYLHKHVIAEVGETTQFLHTDGLGSPVAKTAADQSLISRTIYEPYGRTAAGAAPTIGFTGHVNDVDTGLTYMQQRYYDPVAGRMLSIDPVVTDANTGSSFNRYNYAENNPYRYVDPDGRKVVVVGGKEFKKEITKQLKEVNATAAGRENFDTANRSKHLFTIEEGFGSSYANPTDLAKAQTPGVGSGGTLTHDPIATPVATTEAGELQTPPKVVLGHEISHLADYARGTLDRSVNPETGVKRSEESATKQENRMRKEMGEPARTQYK